MADPPQPTGSPIPLSSLAHQGTTFYASQAENTATPYLPHQPHSPQQVSQAETFAASPTQHTPAEFPYTTSPTLPQSPVQQDEQSQTKAQQDSSTVEKTIDKGEAQVTLPHQAVQKGYEQVTESRQYPNGQGEYIGHVGSGPAPLEGVLLEKQRKREREAARKAAGGGCCRCVVM